METNFLSYDSENEDFIDIEVSSYANFFHRVNSSPRTTGEFEFHMSSTAVEKAPTESPADELFYKGKLLPLHLPPRLQMVENILQNPKSYNWGDTFEESYSTPVMTTPTTTSTPFESCNVTPVQSCQVSGELNFEEYFLEYQSDVFIGENHRKKKSWSKKLKMVKELSLNSKLKASKVYIKSLFGKTGCSDKSCMLSTKVADEGLFTNVKDHQSVKKHVKVSKKTPMDRNIHGGGGGGASGGSCRRSFPVSSQIRSSSTSNYSTGMHALQFLKKSSVSNSEVEISIQGAISHCKLGRT